MSKNCFPVASLLLAVGLAGCARETETPAATAPSVQVPLPSGARTVPPGSEASSAALAAYELYWQISEQAGRAPREKDWRPELGKAMADPALTDYVNEVANLASVPAHTVGRYGRTPKVTSVSLGEPPRVVITDCLDATDEHLVSDKAGELGRNLDHPDQPRRYEFEAQVVRYPEPDRWLVQQVQPRLEKPC
ncbi:hypothetical protein SAMN05421837_12125 [Amycolatopsis pretoriensis]|uniref:Lipoprotein n=2 Tax=Amycolatopsis pretoriensis TaxID=218821 RepID=A0A1H5RJX1_9PSEU|nr:hypothetical protein SAMN05421837_12125 [Amycolatopsis pretoriensis]